MLYGLSLDELIDFNVEQKEIEAIIEKTSEETQKNIDWNKVWAKKYPVLASYQQQVRIEDYGPKLKEMLARLQREYGYGRQDACLVLKDILARVWREP